MLTKKASDLKPGDTIRPKPNGAVYCIASVTRVHWTGISLEINGAPVRLSAPANEVVIVGVMEKGREYVGQVAADSLIEVVKAKDTGRAK